MLNRVELIGHLACDPEVGEERGKPVTYFRLATNFRFGPPVWHSVAVTGKRGAALIGRLTTGSRIYLQGRLRYRKVWDEEDSRFRERAEVVAVGDVLFLDRPNDRDPSVEADFDLEPTDEELGIPPEEPEFENDDGGVAEIEF